MVWEDGEAIPHLLPDDLALLFLRWIKARSFSERSDAIQSVSVPALGGLLSLLAQMIYKPELIRGKLIAVALLRPVWGCPLGLWHCCGIA